MLQKVLQHSDSPESQSKYLNLIVDNLAKDSRQYITELNHQLVNSFIHKNVLYQQNVPLWLQLSLNLLSLQECFMYADLHASIDTPALKLLQALGSKNLPNFHTMINPLLSKSGTLQYSLVLLSFLARHSTKQTPQSAYPDLLPTFIRLSSFITQKYIQLKNQPAKGSEDRIEDDKVILECCQKWLVGCISHFFLNLKKMEDNNIRQIVLIAVGDVVGALLQIQREGVLDKTLISSLLQQTLVPYILHNFTYTDLYKKFNSGLQAHKFMNPIKKIQIPESYSSTLTSQILNTQAYCLFIVKLLKNTSASTLLSPQTIVKILVPAVAEILVRPYQVKIQAIGMLGRALDGLGKVEVRTGWEWEYPVQLLLFYFWQYQKQKYNQIRSKFTFSSPSTHLQSLLALNNLGIQNLQKQIQKYILTQIQRQKLYDNNRVFLLLNKIQWKEQKPKRQLFILDVVEKMKQKCSKQMETLIGSWGKVTENAEVKERLDKIKQL